MPKGLSPLRGIKNQINVVLGSQIPNLSAYRRNLKEAKELKRQLEEFLKKGLIIESLSRYSKVINKITIKYRNSIPRLDGMFYELCGSSVFWKIDLWSGYLQICMKPDD